METNKELITDEQVESAMGKLRDLDASIWSRAGLDARYIMRKVLTAALSQRSEAVPDVSWEDGFHNLLFALKIIAGAPSTCDDPVKAAQMFSTMPWVEALEALGIHQTAPAPSAAAEEQADWRQLALKFDGHRMAALWHLRAMLNDPVTHKAKAEEFLTSQTDPVPSVAADEQVRAWDAYATQRLYSIVYLLGLQSVVPDDDQTGYVFAVLGFVRREIERLKGAAHPTPAQGDVAGQEAYGEDWLGRALDLESQARRVESNTVRRTMEGAAICLRLMGKRLAATPAQGDAVPVALSDEDIVSVLHGCGIDTHPSKYGFTELQVSATSIPSIREVVRRCNELLATRQSSADAVDAARYRWLCNGNGYFMEENSLCGHSNEKELADSAIDAAIAAQGGKE